MKTILVPTDFSAVAQNAATYALRFAADVKAARLVLYNAYQAPVIAEPTVPAVQMIDFDALKEISTSGLEHLQQHLAAMNVPGITIETASEFGVFDTAVNEVCEKYAADIIVMGITGGSNLEEVLIGSTATNVAQHTQTPVLIIPPRATYRPVKTMVMACDFKHVKTRMPLQAIGQVVTRTAARLHVVHVDEHKRSEGDFAEPIAVMQQLLQQQQPEFHFVHHPDFVEGLNEFAHQIAADMLVVIPKTHGLFESIFRRSHTRHLAFHTDLPLLSIHEAQS